MIARFDFRAEEKKRKEFERQRQHAVESFILYYDEAPYQIFCRKYKIKTPDSLYGYYKNIMTLALDIDCSELTKIRAKNWLENWQDTSEGKDD